MGVHALLLLLFILMSYTVNPPPPVPQDGGLEVNLGTSDNGSGNDQPQSTKDPAAYQASVVYKPVAAKSNIPKDIVRSTEADAPDVDNTKKSVKAPPVSVTAKPVEKPKPQEKPKYLMPGSTGQGGNSAAQNVKGTSEGNTTGPGDRGVPGGTPGAANYTGIPGSGTGGIGHTLAGRDVNPKKFEAEFSESGKVVIHVTVDRNGTIIDKRVKNSSSPKLTKVALDEISKLHFSKSDGQEPEQSGDITFSFTTRQ